MIGHIDRDEAEEKRCYDEKYGMKQKSYRLGFDTGKSDRKNRKDLSKKSQCPFIIPTDLLVLLKKRARWFAGYEAGWQSQSDRFKKKKKK